MRKLFIGAIALTAAMILVGCGDTTTAEGGETTGSATTGGSSASTAAAAPAFVGDYGFVATPEMKEQLKSAMEMYDQMKESAESGEGGVSEDGLAQFEESLNQMENAGMMVNADNTFTMSVPMGSGIEGNWKETEDNTLEFTPTGYVDGSEMTEEEKETVTMVFDAEAQTLSGRTEDMQEDLVMKKREAMTDDEKFSIE